MPALTTIALIAGAAIAAAGTGVQVNQSLQQAQDSRVQGREADKQQKSLEAQLQAQKDKAAKDSAATAAASAAAAQQAQAKQQQRLAGASLYGDVKTSPLGAPGNDATFVRKMALGL